VATGKTAQTRAAEQHESAAAGSLTGAAATDATVLSGHGMYDVANGMTTIPSGTTFTMPTGLGNSISDAYGGAIECGTSLSPFTNGNDWSSKVICREARPRI
jgi:hypothetical protein